MKTAVWLGVVLSLLGCSGDDSEPCDVKHRTGTYVLHASERPNGTCGPTPDQVVRVIDPTGLASNCAKDAPDQLSADQCSFTRSYTCATDGGTIAAVSNLAEEEGGDRLTGDLSLIAYDNAGEVVCESTYDVTHTRQ